VLQVNLDETVSAAGISHLSQLKNLSELLFPQSFEYLRNKPVWMCVQVLPHLRVVGERIEARHVLLAHLSELCVDLSTLQLPCQLGLEQLVQSNQVVVPEGVALPNVTALYVQDVVFLGTDVDISRFERITELGLMDQEDVDACLDLLRLLGGQLRKLVLSLERDELRLDEVLDECPGLLELHLLGRPTIVSSETPLAVEVVGQLQALTLDFRHRDTIVQSGLLLQLLDAAVELKFLKLAYLRMWEEDDESDDLLDRLKEKRVLQQLQTFLYYDFTSDCEYETTGYPFPEYDESLGWVLAALEVKCPNVTKIQKYT
jgi:hypothetical protein